MKNFKEERTFLLWFGNEPIHEYKRFGIDE